MRHWRGPFDRQGYHHGNLKEALIEAAQRFIAERGLGGFTLADAAKLVGVTPAALYRHFRGRDALVAEVAFRGFTQLAERLGRALEERRHTARAVHPHGRGLSGFRRAGAGLLCRHVLRPQSTERERRAAAECRQAAQQGNAFDFLVKALSDTFPEGFTSVDVRFIAIEVWALSHGIATLSAAGQLPKGPGLPDKYELLRAGVLALVHGARRQVTAPSA